jgi:hypothetical protein
MYYNRKRLRKEILAELKKIMLEQSAGSGLSTSAAAGKKIGPESGGAGRDVKIQTDWGKLYGQYDPAELADSFLLRFFGLPKSVEDLFFSLFSPVPGHLGLFPQLWQTGGDITRLVIRVLTETVNPADGRLGDDWFVTTFPVTSRVLGQGLDTLTGRSSQGRFSLGRNVPGGRITEAGFDLGSLFGDDTGDQDSEESEEVQVNQEEEILPDVGNEDQSNLDDSISTLISALETDLASIESSLNRLRSSSNLLESVRVYKEIVPIETSDSQLQQVLSRAGDSEDLDQINNEFIDNVAIRFIRELLDQVQTSFQQAESLPPELRSAATSALEDTISKL